MLADTVILPRWCLGFSHKNIFNLEVNVKDVVYFELNNWMAGKDYPNCDPYKSWMNDFNLYDFLGNDEWCKKNKLCVRYYDIDMSVNFLVSAPKDWVERYCESLLEQDRSFVRKPDKTKVVRGRNGKEFLKYNVENYGSHKIEEE